MLIYHRNDPNNFQFRKYEEWLLNNETYYHMQLTPLLYLYNAQCESSIVLNCAGSQLLQSTCCHTFVSINTFFVKLHNNLLHSPFFRQEENSYLYLDYLFTNARGTALERLGFMLNNSWRWHICTSIAGSVSLFNSHS